MEAQTTLVRSKGAVHLDAITAIDLNLSFVINPRNAELNHPFRLDEALEDFAVPIFLVPLNGRFDGFEDFGYRLKELRLIRIASFDNFEDFLDRTHRGFYFCRLFPYRANKKDRARSRVQACDVLCLKHHWRLRGCA